MAFKKLDIKGNIEKYFRENGINYDRNYLVLLKKNYSGAVYVFILK